REARRRDTSPGRVLHDAAIVAAALAKPSSADALLNLREWQSKGNRRRAPQWYPAIEEALALSDKQLPAKRGPRGDGPPQPRMWRDKRPEAHARLLRAREGMTSLSERHEIPMENLLQPDAMRRACWEYSGAGQSEIETFLAGRGARPWQIEVTAPMLAAAFLAAEADVTQGEEAGTGDQDN
ncbi:MAG: HRDC domain-containing protein, partial [Demequina sp.]